MGCVNSSCFSGNKLDSVIKITEDIVDSVKELVNIMDSPDIEDLSSVKEKLLKIDTQKDILSKNK